MNSQECCQAQGMLLDLFLHAEPSWSTQLLLHGVVERGLHCFLPSIPLHSTSIKGHLEIVQFLIEKGAEVNLKDDRGQTALNLASDPNIFFSKYSDVTDAKAKKLLLASRKEIAKYLTSISK